MHDTRDTGCEAKAARRRSALPEGAWPRLMRAPRAAAYLDIAVNTFFAWVKAGQMPQPKRVGRIVLWDRHELDLAAAQLPGGDPCDDDVWDHVEL